MNNATIQGKRSASLQSFAFFCGGICLSYVLERVRSIFVSELHGSVEAERLDAIHLVEADSELAIRQLDLT